MAIVGRGVAPAPAPIALGNTPRPAIWAPLQHPSSSATAAPILLATSPHGADGGDDQSMESYLATQAATRGAGRQRGPLGSSLSMSLSTSMAAVAAQGGLPALGGSWSARGTVPAYVFSPLFFIFFFCFALRFVMYLFFVVVWLCLFCSVLFCLNVFAFVSSLLIVDVCVLKLDALYVSICQFVFCFSDILTTFPHRRAPEIIRFVSEIIHFVS